ncbi:MAG: 4-(cytidine 5'-diphospho)-2-C-methyl-D-erythritol kinase [Nitrospiraceae bacterium]|nr:MAG: 4-(cytidine 5'-diphospho)-2-C-methyl-D-erythritol kinase [Nitrospiraceae bacterium]
MLTLKAPAKINWFLHILGRRADGYHEIESLIQKVTLYDILCFSPSDDVSVSTAAPLPLEENLVYRAAMMMKRRWGVRRGALIRLEKNIPMGAGLGGGSSDAAAALLGLNRLWELGRVTEDLAGLAEELGSDVPFFLSGALSHVRGRGEKLTPCRPVNPMHLLLVKPHIDVSTAWAYRNYALLTKKTDKVNNMRHFIRKIERAELSGPADGVSNDLESVTLNSYPEIAEVKERLYREGATFSLMSGSGSAVFGVFSAPDRARAAARAFSRRYWTAVVDTMID